MSFTFPVEVAEVLVRGGQVVRAGEVLVRARDEDFVAQRDLQRVIAESKLEVERAKASMDQAEVEFQAQEALLARNVGGSKIDFDRARAQLAIRRAEYELARREARQQEIQLQVREAQLERYRLRAPFDGVIDSVVVDVGEVKRETEGVLRVVNIDPLWLDVPTPTAKTLTLRLSPGKPAWVLVDVPGEAQVWMGTVVEVAAEADPSSNTRRVRVELPNPERWPSGLSAWVRFTAPEGAWRERVVDRRGSIEARAGTATRAGGQTP